MEFCAFTPNLHVCSFREDRVKMCGDRDQRSRTGSLADSYHIPFRIDIDIGEPTLTQHLCKRLGSLFLLKRGRFDFGDLDDFTHETIMICGNEIFGSLKLWICKSASCSRNLGKS